MGFRILRGNDMQAQPWANGAGSTREIARGAAQGKGGEWDWRLSVADVTTDAPFSVFPGVDRVLVLLSGAGIMLRFADGRVITLDTPYAVARFAGEEPLHGGPLDGPTTDFNLMWRRDRFDAELWVRPMVGSVQVFAAPGETWVMHVAAGTAAVDDESLDAGDTLLLDDDGSARRLRIDGAGMGLLVRLRERQPDG